MASLLPFLFLALTLSLSLPATAAPSPAQRHLLRSLADGSSPAADAALDLNATTFDDALRTSPTSYAIVEFFAHWCPACRNYKPQYEKVARLFNGPDAAHPGIILMTRVDCAMKNRRMRIFATDSLLAITPCCFGDHLLNLLMPSGVLNRIKVIFNQLMMEEHLNACSIG